MNLLRVDDVSGENKAHRGPSTAAGRSSTSRVVKGHEAVGLAPRPHGRGTATAQRGGSSDRSLPLR